jgi:phage FluMu gp28-like protein
MKSNTNKISNEKLIKIADTLIGGLYPYQRKLLLSDKKQIIVNKSRQIGISYCIACWALLNAIFRETTELIISPSQRQSKHMMDYIYGFLKRLQDDFTIPLREETKTSIIFDTGGEIHSLPNSANTVRGYRADHIWIDEFAHFTNQTDKEIIQAIAPSISRGGSIVYISTPFGTQNLFYEYFTRENNQEIEKMTINYRECPDINISTIEQYKTILGEDGFLQEYENQFLSDAENQEFPMSLIQSCINPELQYHDLQKEKMYLGGADIGRKEDQTAFIAVEKQGEKYIVRNKHIMKDTPYHEQLNFFTYLLNNFTFDKFHIDESGIGNMLAEELARRYPITRVTFNNQNKQEMVSNLKRLMQEGKLQYPDDPQLIANLRAIKRKYTSTNYLVFESDRDSEIGHADVFWSLALAVYGETTKTPFAMPVHV